MRARLPLSKAAAWEEQIEDLKFREARNDRILSELTQLKNSSNAYKEELDRNKEQVESDIARVRGRIRSMAQKVEAYEQDLRGGSSTI